jgi:hypothetical protein
LSDSDQQGRGDAGHGEQAAVAHDDALDVIEPGQLDASREIADLCRF